jgi:hypothetical protein
VEGGGKTVQRAVLRSNPTGCQGRDCLVCKGGDGTGLSCRKSNMVHEIGCHLCPANQQVVYVGETARNAYTRCREHNRNYEKEDSESFMFKHQREEHHGAQADFKASVKYSFKRNIYSISLVAWLFVGWTVGVKLGHLLKSIKLYSFKESLSRQIVEGVAIRRCDKIVMNSKAEWHQPAIWRVRSELSRE